jgi:hypothetical protein
MNDEAGNLDHTDAETLTADVSDDALEIAGDPGAGRPYMSFAGDD